MKKLLVLLLNSTLCFNNAFLTIHALEDDPVPSEEPTEVIVEDNESETSEEIETTDTGFLEEVQEEPSETSKDTAEATNETEDDPESEEENDQESAPTEEPVIEPEEETTVVEEGEDEGLILTESSGSCGEACTYTLSDTGVLTISGSGAMADYDGMSVFNQPPWYHEAMSITQIVVNEGITSIGDSAFYKCSATGVTMPNSVTKIGKYAFEGCIELPKIEIPEGVTSIGEGAFSGCKVLAEIVIPKSVTEIETGAFEYCTSLSEMVFPSTVACIEDYLFDNCTGLKKITIPNTVTSIEEYAFNECYKLTQIVFIGSEEEWNELLINGTEITGNEDLIEIIPTFIPVSVESVKLDKTNITLTMNDTEQLTATVAPTNASYKTVIWISSNPSVVAVDQNGLVTAMKKGSAVITALSSADTTKKDECQVTVTLPVSGVKLNKTTLTLDKGKTSVLTAAISPTDASNKKVTWKSSNTKVAAVDANGKVSAKGAGTATITVTTEDGGYTADCKVTVVIPVTGVKLNKTSLALDKGKTSTLAATVNPSDASNKKVTWKSSNTKVAAVDSKGKVTAKGAGTATITVTTEDGGYTAECKVTVKVPVTGVKLNKTSLSLEGWGSETLTAAVSPSNATNKKVTWTSSNTKVATVDSKGKVTAKGAGTATITVTTEDGKKAATCKVTVKKDPAACRLNGFCHYNGKDYWYENGVRQGTVNDPKGVIGDGTNRGREIFDPETKAWYWLDSAYEGAKAVGKEVWMPYIYQDEANWKNDTAKMNEIVQAINSYSEAGGPTSDMGEQVRQAILNGSGKWVRYDENGKMMKGWVTISGEALEKLYPSQRGNTYFYDYTTGLMAKGWTTIGGRQFYFDETTGKLLQ